MQSLLKRYATGAFCPLEHRHGEGSKFGAFYANLLNLNIKYLTTLGFFDLMQKRGCRHC